MYKVIQCIVNFCENMCPFICVSSLHKFKTIFAICSGFGLFSIKMVIVYCLGFGVFVIVCWCLVWFWWVSSIVLCDVDPKNQNYIAIPFICHPELSYCPLVGHLFFQIRKVQSYPVTPPCPVKDWTKLNCYISLYTLESSSLDQPGASV